MRRPCLRNIARAVSLRSGRKPGGPASIPFAPSVAISVSTRLGSSCGPHAAASLMPHETGDTATVEAMRPRSGPGLAMLRARAVRRCMAGDYALLSLHAIADVSHGVWALTEHYVRAAEIGVYGDFGASVAEGEAGRHV